MRTRINNKLGFAKWRIRESFKSLSYKLPLPWSQKFLSDFWESQADMIHDHWGSVEHDFQIMNKLFDVYKPSSILDVGCGSGRLFKLYAQCKIQDVVGIDISARALALANKRFPTVPTICGKLEDVDFPLDRFSIAICNRVLQHIPSLAIASVVAKLCQWCRIIYINEITVSDHLSENFYMKNRDYAPLLSRAGFKLLENGLLENQTYYVYGRR